MGIRPCRFKRSAKIYFVSGSIGNFPEGSISNAASENRVDESFFNLIRISALSPNDFLFLHAPPPTASSTIRRHSTLKVYARCYNALVSERCLSLYTFWKNLAGNRMAQKRAAKSSEVLYAILTEPANGANSVT
jgi:hypothetical protein